MQAYDNLLALISADTNLIDDLLGVLNVETESLKKREFQHLDSLSKQKSQISQQLEQNFAKRRQLLQQFGTSDDPLELTQILIKQLSAEQAKKIAQSNQQLEAKLSQCRHMNVVNGQVIAVNLASHQQVNNLLSGNKGPANTYSASGQIQAVSNSNRHQEI